MKTLEAKIVEQENFFVFENSKVIPGSTRMLAVGGGVKARLGKNKEGASVVESYLFDKDRFSKETAEKWLMKHRDNIEESLKRVQENAPAGSFQDITIRLQSAIDNLEFFSAQDQMYAPRPYVMYVFPEYCIVCLNDDYWSIPYTGGDSVIKLGKPVKAEMTFVTKEAAILNEKLNRLSKPNTEINAEYTKLKIVESSVDAAKKTFNAVLIESGMNYTKKRYYPTATIQDGAPLFAGLKMFANHPTEMEERTRPERDIKDWVATIVESWYEDGKAMGKIHVHDKQILENMQDAVYREHIGLSINASGRRYLKTIDGIQVEVIEKIVAPKSVDFVTEPGARGRVEQVVESNKETVEMKTVKELRENYSELVKEVEQSAVASLVESHKVALKEANDRAEKAENELKTIKESEAKKVWREKVEKILSESKMPKKSCEKILESLTFKADISDADLETSVKEAISKEREYLKEVAGIKIGVEAGAPSETTLTEGLEKELGLTEKK